MIEIECLFSVQATARRQPNNRKHIHPPMARGRASTSTLMDRLTKRKAKPKLTLRSGLATSGRTHMTGRIRWRNLILAQQYSWAASSASSSQRWRSGGAIRTPKSASLSVKSRASRFCRVSHQRGYEPDRCGSETSGCRASLRRNIVISHLHRNIKMKSTNVYPSN